MIFLTDVRFIKGASTILLTVVASFVAAYARYAYGGWIFALSFVMVVACSIPMMMHFNPRYSCKAPKPRQRDLAEEFEFLNKPGPFDDPITGFRPTDLD